MSVRVVFFGRLADQFGREEQVTLGDGVSTVGAIIESLADGHPSFANALASGEIRCAVNDALARPNAPVRDGDELALFPPFSGG